VEARLIRCQPGRTKVLLTQQRPADVIAAIELYASVEGDVIVFDHVFKSLPTLEMGVTFAIVSPDGTPTLRAD